MNQLPDSKQTNIILSVPFIRMTPVLMNHHANATRVENEGVVYQIQLIESAIGKQKTHRSNS
jgi:hypothetical protein